jgi:hypothetical protein
MGSDRDCSRLTGNSEPIRSAAASVTIVGQEVAHDFSPFRIGQHKRVYSYLCGETFYKLTSVPE